MGRLPPQQDACCSHLAIPVKLYHWTAASTWLGGMGKAQAQWLHPPLHTWLSSRISFHRSGGLCSGVDLHTGAKLCFRSGGEPRFCLSVATCGCHGVSEPFVFSVLTQCPVVERQRDHPLLTAPWSPSLSRQ